MIEDIFRACEIILVCVAAFVVGCVLFRAVCATVNKIKKNRLKKFIQKAVPCHCGGHAYIEHRFGEFYHIGCTCCSVGFTNGDIPKLVKMWNDVQSIKAGDYVDAIFLRGVFNQYLMA